MTRHHWHTPVIPATTPPTATVVVRASCGTVPPVTLPLWQVRDWQARAVAASTDDCAGCIRADQSHRATLNAGWSPVTVTCDCGETFPATAHPVEADHYDSPQWEQHVKAARS